MLREFYTFLSNHYGEQHNFLSLGNTHYIDLHALFMLGSLEPDIYILGKASFGARTTYEHVLSPFTPAAYSSERRTFFCTLEYS